MKKKIIFFAFILEFFVPNANAQVAIDSHLFGQNAWYIDVSLADPSTSIPNATWDAMAASGVKYVRIGGIDPNFKPLYDFNSTTFAITDISKLTYLIDKIRSTTPAMEPIIQVGFKPASICTTLAPFLTISQANQATIAGNLVTAVKNHYTGLGQQTPMNWIIANEPDLAVDCDDYGFDGDGLGGFGYDNTSLTDAALISSYLQAYSIAMKTAFPTITIIGPELATFGNDVNWKGYKLMKDLISDATLMGTISGGAANGKYYIDVISFHYYPNITGGSARTDVIADPTATHDGFKNKLSTSVSGYKGIVELISNYSSRTSANIKIACTEFNLENAESSYNETTNYSDMIKGVGNRSYLAGQWMAEIFSEAMNSGWVQFMNPWSVQEGNCTDGKGYISGCGSNAKRPTYWHYKMMADNFSGTYYPNVATAQTNFKAFACTTGSEIRVMIMNQTLQSPRGTDASSTTLGICFNNSTPAETLKVTLNLPSVPSSSSYSCKITNETSMLLVFNSGTGSLIRKEVYQLGHALRTSDTGPETWGLTSSTPITLQSNFDSYVDAVYTDLVITPGTSISEINTDTKTFRFSNAATVNGGMSGFTVPLGATFELKPTSTCP